MLTPEVAQRCVQEVMTAMQRRFADTAANTENQIARGPNHANNYYAVPVNLFSFGQFRDAERLLRAFIPRYPNNLVNPQLLIEILLQESRAREAIGVAKATLGRWRSCGEVWLAIVRAHLLLGDPNAADLALADACHWPEHHARSSESFKGEQFLVQAMVEHSLGNAPRSKRSFDYAIEELSQRGLLDSFASRIAEAYAWCGDEANALGWMSRAAQSDNDKDFMRVPFSPFAEPIRNADYWKNMRTAAAQLRHQIGHTLPPAFPTITDVWPH
jgi:predicted Zn-dependent protease